MATQTNVQIIISATDNASNVINQVGKAMSGAGSQMNDIKEGATQAATAFAAVTAAVVGVSAVAVKLASDFQSSMLLIQTQAGAGASEVKNMTQAVLDLAPAVGQTPQKLAEGLFYVESAGYRGAKALDVLKLSAEGAAVGHDDLVSVVKALTSVVNSGIKGIDGTTQAMGVLDAIVGHGKMSMADLTAAMSTGILPAAKQVGLSLQDVGAALDVMTNNGIPAQEAATRLRMTLSLMAAPTDQAQKSLSAVGLSSRSLADDMQKGGIIAAITDLNTHMNAVQQGSSTIVKGTKETGAQLAALGNNILDTNAKLKILQEEHVKAGVATDKHNLAIQEAQQKLTAYTAKLGGANQVINTLGGTTLDAVGKAQLLTKAFGGARSGSSIELMTQQVNQMKVALDGINDTSSKFASSWQATQQTNAQATARLNATVQTLAIQYGNELLPIVTKVENFIADNLAPGLQNLTKFIENNKIALGILAGVITAVLLPAFAGYALFSGVNAVASTISFIATGYSAIGVAAEMAVGIWANVAGFVAYNATMIIATVVTWAQNVALGVMALSVMGVLTPLLLLVAGIAAVIIIGYLLITHWNQVKAVAQTAWKDIETVTRQVFTAIGQFFTTTWQNITNVFNSFIKFLTATFSPAFSTAFNVVKIIMDIEWDIFLLTWTAIQALLDAFSKWLNATFAPLIHTVFTTVQSWLTTINNFFTTVWRAIQNTVNAFGTWLQKIFQPIFSGAMTFLKEALNDINGFFTTIWNAITSTVNSFGNWLQKTFQPIIQASFAWVKTALKDLSDFWSTIWNGISSFVSGIAKDIAGAIKNMLNQIIDFFNSVISGFDKVGSKVPGFIQIPQIPHFATGGVVPGPVGQPVFAMVHGGETINPIGGNDFGLGGGDSGGGVSLTVNVGLYAGTETDKRNIAQALYQALLTLAQSKHMTVAQMMGG